VKVTVDTLTDEAIRELRRDFPMLFTEPLINGALGDSEPHRNHSRAKIAELATGLLCESCTPTYPVENHVTGHRYVGWGHGWEPCIHCGGSGLNAMALALREETRARSVK